MCRGYRPRSGGWRSCGWRRWSCASMRIWRRAVTIWSCGGGGAGGGASDAGAVPWPAHARAVPVGSAGRGAARLRAHEVVLARRARSGAVGGAAGSRAADPAAGGRAAGGLDTDHDPAAGVHGHRSGGLDRGVGPSSGGDGRGAGDPRPDPAGGGGGGQRPGCSTTPGTGCWWRSRMRSRPWPRPRPPSVAWTPPIGARWGACGCAWASTSGRPRPAVMGSAVLR
jgi:hypothetical protein